MAKQRDKVRPEVKPEQLEADREAVADLTKMLEAAGHKVALLHVFENVFIFENDQLQKIIVHHDPAYDCGDFMHGREIYEYFL